MLERAAWGPRRVAIATRSRRARTGAVRARSFISRYETNPEARRPVLAGEQELVGLRYRGDPVEYIGFFFLLGGEQAGSVDLGGYCPVGGVDAHDGIALPHVRVDGIADAGELIELVHTLTCRAHGDVSEDGEALRITKGQSVGAVAHDQPLLARLMAQAPALALVVHPPPLVEGLPVAFDGDAGVPGQLPQPVLDDRDALTEQRGRQICAGELLTGFPVDGTDIRFANQTGAFVECPINDLEALCEGGWIMWKRLQYVGTQLVRRVRVTRLGRFAAEHSGSHTRAAGEDKHPPTWAPVAHDSVHESSLARPVTADEEPLPVADAGQEDSETTLAGMSFKSPEVRTAMPPARPGAAESETAAHSAGLTDAVELAREAAVAEAADREYEPAEATVGEHAGMQHEDDGSLTHLFESDVPGYRGWQWHVTLASAGDEFPVTVSEVLLRPGPNALVAKEWIPWERRVQHGDLGIGDVQPPSADDERLVPGYLASDDPAVEEVSLELGLGRRRVMSRSGRLDAAARWRGGEFGPRSDMARSSPFSCGTCGFYLPLAGSLSAAFGVCGNEIAPADGHTVHVEYGCGAHSEIDVESSTAVPVAELVYDDSLLDVPESTSRDLRAR